MALGRNCKSTKKRIIVKWIECLYRMPERDIYILEVLCNKINWDKEYLNTEY